MDISQIDCIFISYDEPNADRNYAYLLKVAPWAKRVHGVKGSDAAHKAAANMSETEWFVTVDGDNIVQSDFFDLKIDTSNQQIKAYSWCATNSVNGLKYGNGGLKIWQKEFVLKMKTHEAAEDERAQVDFCWENGYKNFPKVYSTSVINTNPFQAWRAGFREGVKMTLLNGQKVDPQNLVTEIYWHNLHRLKIWSCIGGHVANGFYAIHGARLGTYMTNCTDWDYRTVRDFDVLRKIYETNVNEEKLIDDIQQLGFQLKVQLGLDFTFFDKDQSKFVANLYEETINLSQTYYNI